MKAIFKTADGIELGSKEKPWILGDNELCFKVALAGLCRTDLFTAQNKIPISNGTILGHECSGTIEAVGSQVHLALGQKIAVMPLFAEKNGFSMLGIERDGVYAEYVRLPQTHVYPVPEHLSFEEAAFMEPIAACLSVVKAPLQPHHQGLIYGNNRIAELTKRILFHKGIKNVDIQEGPLTKQYDFVIETCPSEVGFTHMIAALKPRGFLILKSRPYHSIPLPLHSIVQKEITLIGTHYGEFQEAIDLVAHKHLDVGDLLGRTYSFEEALPILRGEILVSEDKKIFFTPKQS